MKKLILFWLLLPHISSAQSDLRTAQAGLIGSQISEIRFTDYIRNEPADKIFDNKFKVLEFWATWCKACLAAVPHINRLQEKFKSENIVFLSVTDEKPEVTFKTLNRVKFETVVVSDRTRTVHRNLKIEYNNTMALPRTVLIDDENRIVWYGSPKDLTKSLIEKFLKKQPLQ